MLCLQLFTISPANQIHLYLETSGVEKLCCSFFSMVKIRPSFLGKSPPWLAFLDDIPCVMFLWGGICFEFLGKSHGVKGSIPREGVVDVIFSRQAPKIWLSKWLTNGEVIKMLVIWPSLTINRLTCSSKLCDSYYVQCQSIKTDWMLF